MVSIIVPVQQHIFATSVNVIVAQVKRQYQYRAYQQRGKAQTKESENQEHGYRQRNHARDNPNSFVKSAFHIRAYNTYPL